MNEAAVRSRIYFAASADVFPENFERRRSCSAPDELQLFFVDG
jgi:hypothetical protein